MMRAVFLAALATSAAALSATVLPAADLPPATRAAVMAFVQDYNTNFADYETACKEVGATLHTALDAAGFFVHPDVSYRAKAPASLEKKLLERAVEKKYTTIAEVAADIVDLIGVRITVYTPSIDLDKVDAILRTKFTLRRAKIGGDGTSAYDGNNYVVEFTRANGQKVPVEVQARGAMMHAFWQINHFFQYKPSRPLSTKEQAQFTGVLTKVKGAAAAMKDFVAVWTADNANGAAAGAKSAPSAASAKSAAPATAFRDLALLSDASWAEAEADAEEGWVQLPRAGAAAGAEGGNVRGNRHRDSA